MKKLMSLALALLMVLSLAACGGKDTASDGGSQDAQQTADASWPEKEITIIQPWSLGGGPDVITRQIASYSQEYLGVPMIVENHTGGSGTIGMNDFLDAADDGYTLFCCNGPLFSLTPSFIDVEFTGMDYFAVRSTVDESKQEILREFIQKVYADPEFQEFMEGMGNAVWNAGSEEILSMVAAQSEAMTKYIPLVQ
ncbi:Bug family tripartite tricarboxylate transporter substrate binding protein [Dysosmobacter sp.]|uniref:Bug family tripartite tricarboxylate transporter substrate binding protein n=1 Tax=Dysosmobacter sp. TaxID=2591382 RepID=UPI003AB8F846